MLLQKLLTWDGEALEEECTYFQVSASLNPALNREGLTRESSYPESACGCAGGEGAWYKQALLRPMWAVSSLAGCWGFFLEIYFQADPAVDWETKALAMRGLWPALLPRPPAVLRNVVVTEWQLSCKADLSLARSSLSLCTQLPDLLRSLWNLTRDDSLHFLLNGGEISACYDAADVLHTSDDYTSGLGWSEPYPCHLSTSQK